MNPPRYYFLVQDKLMTSLYPYLRVPELSPLHINWLAGTATIDDHPSLKYTEYKAVASLFPAPPDPENGKDDHLYYLVIRGQGKAAGYRQRVMITEEFLEYAYDINDIIQHLIMDSLIQMQERSSS